MCRLRRWHVVRGLAQTALPVPLRRALEKRGGQLSLNTHVEERCAVTWRTRPRHVQQVLPREDAALGARLFEHDELAEGGGGETCWHFDLTVGGAGGRGGSA